MEESSIEVLMFLFSKDPEIEASPTSEPRVPVVVLACSSDIEWRVIEFSFTINVFLLSSLLNPPRLMFLLRNWSAASGLSTSMHGRLEAPVVVNPAVGR